MTEEVKSQKKDAKFLSLIFKVTLGFVFLALGVWAIINWWPDLLAVIRGCLGLFLILAGVITLAIAKE